MFEFLANLFKKGTTPTVGERVGRLEKEQETMANKYDDLVKALDTATDNVAKRLAALELKAGDTITDAQVQSLQTAVAHLQSIGKDSEAPIPAAVVPPPDATAGGAPPPVPPTGI